MESDHVAMVGTHVAKSMATRPRRSKYRRNDRKAVTTNCARLEVTKIACRCTNAVMSAAVIR